MAELTEKELFEKVPVPRAVARLIVPTIISQIVTVIYNLADTFFIGQIGDPAMVAGATLVSPWFNPLTALSNLVGIGGISVMDKLLGRHEYDEVKKVSSFSFWAGALITALFCGLTFAFAQPLLSLLSIASTDTEGGALGYAYTYMLWTVVIGGLPTALAMTLAHFLRGEGQAKKASAGMMSGGILNIGLDPLFMFAFRMGFVGAGIATALSNFISFLFLLGMFLYGRKTSTMSISPRWFSFRYTGKVLSVGLSAAFTTLLANVVFMIINILAYGYDDAAVSAYGIVKRLDQIPLGISLGLSQGVMPLIAYNYGSGDYARLKKVSVFSWILAAIMSAVCVVLFETLAPYIARLMLDDEKTVPLTTDFLRIACTAVPFTSVNALVMYFFQAMGKGTQATVLAVCRQGALNIPMLFLMNWLVGLYGMIWVQLIIELIMLPFMLGMYFYTMKKLGKGGTRS